MSDLKLSYSVDSAGLAEDIPEGAFIVWGEDPILELQDLPATLVVMTRKAVDADGKSVPVAVISDDANSVIIPLMASQVVKVLANNFDELLSDDSKKSYSDFVLGVYKNSTMQVNPAALTNAVFEWSGANVVVPSDREGQIKLNQWLGTIRAQLSRTLYVFQNYDMCCGAKMDWNNLAKDGAVL